MILRFDKRGQNRLSSGYENIYPTDHGDAPKGLWCFGSLISGALVEADNSRSRVLSYACSIEIVVVVAKMKVQNIDCYFLLVKITSVT